MVLGIMFNWRVMRFQYTNKNKKEKKTENFHFACIYLSRTPTNWIAESVDAMQKLRMHIIITTAFL